jgi:hypothetical protein
MLFLKRPTLVTVMPAMNKVSLYSVKTADALLGHTKRQLLIARIKKSTDLEEAYFETLYMPVIERFAEFVQALPYIKGGKRGGLLDYGLVRAALVSQAYVGETGKKADPLYTYAIFTVALLRDIGKVVSQQKVMISDAQGQFLAEWLPFAEPLTDKAQYYKIRVLDDRWLLLGQAVTPLLARQLMPVMGFSLIAEDYELLQKWMGVLLGSGTIEGDLFLNLLQLVEKQLDAELEKLQIPPLSLEPIEPEEPEKTKSGEDFLEWLNDALEKDKIPRNQADSAIHALETGEIFLDIKLFQLFCQQYAHRTDWLTVLQQFNRLGLTKGIQGEGQVEKFYANYPDSAVKSRMPYFLTSEPKGLGGSGGGAPKTGLNKVLQGVVVTRTELLNLKFGQLGISQLGLQPVIPVIPGVTNKVDMRAKLSEYLERRQEERSMSRGRG